MSKISCGQLAALLLIVDGFTLLCINGGVTIVTAVVFLGCTLIQLLLAMPAAAAYKNGKKIKDCPKPILWIYLLYILIWGGMLFVMLWNVSDVLSIPSENIPFIPEKLLISGLIAVVCLYASSPGAKGLSRAAVIAGALGIVCAAVIIIGAISEFKTEYLFAEARYSGIFDEIIRGFVLSGSAGSFIVLLGSVDGSAVKAAVGYFIARAVIWTAVLVTTVAVTGGIMKITDFPVAMAAELSQPFYSQRIDSLFLIVFAILAVFAIAAQTLSASYLFSTIFPNFKEFRSTAALLLMILAAFLVSSFKRYEIVCAAAVLIILLLMPLALKFSKEKK